MKRWLILFLSVFMVLSFAACGMEGASDSGSATSKSNASGSVETKQVAPAPKTGDKVLVAYFSCTGTTKAVAEEAAAATGADLFEIQPEQPYTSTDLNYNDETTRATVEQKNDSARPKIKTKIENLGDYDTVILAYPIWWGQAPRIIDTFLESYNFAGKTILPICTSSSSDIGSSAKYLHSFTPEAKWKEGARLEKGAAKDAVPKLLAGESLE